MLNCNQATKLLSDELESPLSRPQYLALKLHVLLCDGCRNFGKQIRFLRRVGQAFNRLDEGADLTDHPKK